MSLICPCPPNPSITDIPTDECVERIGQVQKVILQRKKNGTALNSMPYPDAPTLATWNALKAATDSTKVQVTPFIQEPTMEAGEKREYGGGNQTLGGIPVVIGRNPSAFSGVFLDVKQSIIAAVKTYECEKNLSVYLVNEQGQIIGLVDNVATPTVFMGIPITSFFVSDKVLGGFEEPDKNNVSWSMMPNWSDNLAIISPSDFDALSEI